MNKKGYTLIELIAVIAIIAAVGTFGVVGVSKLISNSKQQRYDEMVEDLKAAGNTYFSIYSEKSEYSYLKERLYSSPNQVKIKIDDLKEALLVDENLKDPKTNELVSGCVIITYTSGTINYTTCITSSCNCN